MSGQTKVNYLVTILSLSFILICIFIYYFTADKSEWYLKLLNNLVPELLGPLIAILFIFYAFTIWEIDIFKPNEPSNAPQYKISIADIPVESFGVELKSHVNNARVERVNHFYGEYKNLPENVKLRIYIANENQSVCWINSHNVVTNANDKTWQSTVYVGGANNDGDVFYVIVAIKDAVTDQWVDYYKKVSEESQDWKSFKYPLPKGIVETNKLKVVRI